MLSRLCVFRHNFAFLGDNLNVPGAKSITLHEDRFYHQPFFCQEKPLLSPYRGLRIAFAEANPRDTQYEIRN